MADRHGLNQAWVSEHDRVTGLHTRRRFVKYLEWLLRQPSQPARIALCLIDLDDFRAVNEGLGRQLGDRLLGEVAVRLRALVGQDSRRLARLGPDEFAILLTRTADLAEAESLAERVVARIAEPFLLDGHSVRITASVGVVERATAGQGAPDLIGAAANALRWARADGGGRCSVFTADRGVSARARLELAAELSTALADGEIGLYYQPLVELPGPLDRRPARVVGFEALARWTHPRRGLVSPGEFIPLAHELGLIQALGTRLLRLACQHAATWNRAGDGRPYVSVNVATEQLKDPGLVDVVLDALADAGLPPEQLQLEITEHSLLETDDATRASLNALARHKVRLTLDDFGTGYSNLTVLPELPLHGLKLDCAFIRNRAAETQFLKNIVSLGRVLGLHVTAEGVETAEQAALVRRLGCQVGQGWLYGRPVPVEETYRFLWHANSPRWTGWSRRAAHATVARHAG